MANLLLIRMGCRVQVFLACSSITQSVCQRAFRNDSMDQLATETLDQDINPLANVHDTDLKPLVTSYIQHLVKTKWGVAVHGRDLNFVKPTLG